MQWQSHSARAYAAQLQCGTGKAPSTGAPGTWLPQGRRRAPLCQSPWYPLLNATVQWARYKLADPWSMQLGSRGKKTPSMENQLQNHYIHNARFASGQYFRWWKRPHSKEIRLPFSCYIVQTIGFGARDTSQGNFKFILIHRGKQPTACRLDLVHGCGAGGTLLLLLWKEAPAAARSNTNWVTLACSLKRLRTAVLDNGNRFYCIL